MIVVGVDFSEGSVAAVEWARDMSARRSEAVQLVHVASGSGVVGRLDPVYSAWLDELAIGADEVEIRRGTPWVELVRAGEERGAVLLVAGTHGRSGFQSLRLGSTAAQTALRSRTPVVLVSPERIRKQKSGMSQRGSNEEMR